MNFTMKAKEFDTYLLIESKGQVDSLEEYKKLTMSYLKHLSDSGKEKVICDERALKLPNSDSMLEKLPEFYIHDLPEEKHSWQCGLVSSRENREFSEAWDASMQKHGLHTTVFLSLVDAMDQLGIE